MDASHEIQVENFQKNLEVLPRTLNRTNSNLKKLVVASIICFLIFSIELIGGILANSLAIISDAAHMLSDLAAFVISILSLLLSLKQPTNKMTFGYHRYQVFGALISITMIWYLTFWLVSQAVYRVLNPQPVNGFIMIVSSVIGLISNVFMGLTLHDHGHHHGSNNHQAYNQIKEDSQQKQSSQVDKKGFLLEEQKKQKKGDLNVRAALLHVVGDILSNIGIVCSAVVLWIKPTWVIIDPICTFIFAVIILLITFPTLKECVSIILERSPSCITEKLENELTSLEKVEKISNFHLWCISKEILAFSCQITTKSPSKTLKEVTAICKEQYGIQFVTIQVNKSKKQSPDLSEVEFNNY